NQLVYLTIARENDGLGLAWMEKFRTQEAAWFRDREALGRLLWWDPDQKPIYPATLPTTRLFPTSGHVVMRSDWSPNATFATFRCGRFGEIDGHWGRNNADNLSFTIRKRGPLAIDSGPVHGQNIGVLKFHSNDGFLDYGRQTIAHNSITIGDAKFVHRDWQGKPVRDIVRRGGQSVRQADSWWEAWGFEGRQKDFMEGRIAAYRTHPLYDYALGDARFSYRPEAVKEITRQFVYLKPDIFVIYDRIVPVDPAQRPCWLLHSLREPKATGAERALTQEEIGPQVMDLGEQQVPHPRPGGHFAMSGHMFWVESGSPGAKGDCWLKVQTLIPRSKHAERKKIGGRHHDFEVGGVQYGLSDEGYGKADDPYAVLSTIGLLGWRVELRQREPSETVEFLHVLWVGAGPRDELGYVVPDSTAEAHRVVVSQGKQVFELTLRRTGARGGSIRVTETREGKTLHEAELPESVEDHWRHYRDDANFKTWMTDPRYRVVIEPTDEDRKAAGGE
ncbi:heparinase II/III family protein, partial [bacterium]|nr:heparinase II/III family protein [bacterium]